MSMKKRIVLGLLLLFVRMICYSQMSPSVELRGVWIATVYNIDWPSSSGLSSKAQKHEIIEILDYYKKLNFNSVFVQVRPSADTFYPSEYEPWSKYLTGKQGQKPKPYYDPLKFWIKEAHKRGIEFHAWINPFRIANSENEVLASNHPAVKHPDWVINYGGKLLYNPALPQCRNHITNMVGEIVRNYEVDGIHFDDYFYPYPKTGVSLNDSVFFNLYGSGIDSIEDWRRDNVNVVVKQVHDVIKKINPHVQFGISPFGVWRNRALDERGSDTNAGITNYDSLYADVLLWLKNDLIDYVTPQLYWSTQNKVVPFEHLCQWWTEHSFGKDVFVGLAAYKLDSAKLNWNKTSQLTNQIKILRSKHGVNGSIFFSHNHIKSNKLAIADSLQLDCYKYPSLLPPVYGYEDVKLPVPEKLKWHKNRLKWKSKKINKTSKPMFYAVYGVFKGGHRQLLCFSKKKKVDASVLPVDLEKVYGFVLTAVGKYNLESPGSEIIYLKSR